MIKFKGKVDALKGFHYDCSNVKQADMYAKATKKTLDVSDEYTKRVAISALQSRLEQRQDSRSQTTLWMGY
jgi:hypothetical protein